MMNLTRWTSGTRTAVAALVVALLLGALALQGGGPPSVAAKPKPRPVPVDSFRSKADFKAWCELYGGTFIDSATQTACLEDTGVTVCDPDGKNCLSYPNADLPPLTRPTPANHQTGGLTTLAGGSTDATGASQGGGSTLVLATPVTGGGRGDSGGPPQAAATPAA